MRMTNETFAEHLGVAVRTVAYWRARPDVEPRTSMQQILDVALARAPEPARAQFWDLLRGADRNLAGVAFRADSVAADDAASLTEWLTTSSTSDEAISSIDRATATLADAHARRAPAELLTDVRHLQAGIQRLLRDGRLRHRQERELLRINGDVLAHLSLLLSDLDHTSEADQYGNAALLFFREAGASEATAWYVLAKNARWRHHYLRAADLASQGLQRGSAGPMRVQLACYEANASALAGDASRARAAMRHAEESAALLPTTQATASPWSFPEQRMTIFRLSVALHTGDPDEALRIAATTDPSWSPDGPHVPAAWAQIRIGGAIAWLLKDEPDGTVEHVSPVLAMPPELRIATVTGWLADLDHQLRADRHASDPIAMSLRRQIRDFTKTALCGAPIEEEH